MTLADLIAGYSGTLAQDALCRAGNIAWGHLMQQTLGRVETCGAEHTAALSGCFRELVETIDGVSSTAGSPGRRWGLDTGLCRGPTFPGGDVWGDHPPTVGRDRLLYRGWPK